MLRTVCADVGHVLGPQHPNELLALVEARKPVRKGLHADRSAGLQVTRHRQRDALKVGRDVGHECDFGAAVEPYLSLVDVARQAVRQQVVAAESTNAV